MICEICGYESEKDVWKRPDGIIRCKMCANRAVYGRSFIPDMETFTVPLSELQRRNKQWETHEINKEINGE